MSLTQSDTSARPIERSAEVDLAALGLRVPDGTTTTIEVRGTPASFVVELERNYRWVVEGTSHSAELTGVFGGNGRAEKPATVPEWIVRVLEVAVDVDEVTV